MGQAPKPTQSSLSSKENGNTTKSSSGVSQSQSQKRKLPTAQELISHYESKGMDTKDASLKVIDDLQKALFRVVVSTSNSNTSGTKRKNYDQQQVTAGTGTSISISRKLDVINSRLLNLDMKVDSKPGYGETLAIGLASGAAFRGLESLFPHVAGALAHIWNSVRSATNH